MSVTFSDLISISVSEDSFLQIFQDVVTQQEEIFSEAHETILTACFRSPGLSPSLKGDSPQEVALSWLKKYNQSYKNRISQRISKIPATVADPIIDVIINARLTGLNLEQLEQIKYAHRLSMSAENILGLFLEEFLARQLGEFGWSCCWGECIRHVDFCHVDGSLLQVKNRSNSENSSSSRVRINQPIEKWYRVDAKTGSYQWSYFNKKYSTDRFSEENFVAFVREVLSNNPQALAIEHNNPWK